MAPEHSVQHGRYSRVRAGRADSRGHQVHRGSVAGRRGHCLPHRDLRGNPPALPRVHEALKPHTVPLDHKQPHRTDAVDAEDEESPEQVWHFIVVPVSALHLASLRASACATSFAAPILAVHIAPDEDDAFRRQWEQPGNHVQLEVIVSPYRARVPPLAHYIAALNAQRPDLMLTVVRYELVVQRPWHSLLQVPLAARLRLAMRLLTDVVITSVPFHVPD